MFLKIVYYLSSPIFGNLCGGNDDGPLAHHSFLEYACSLHCSRENNWLKHALDKLTLFVGCFQCMITFIDMIIADPDNK
jgi:hypothetical protein